MDKKKKQDFEYRLRWDDVQYEPGELKVMAYKNGTKWAEETVRTTGVAAQLKLSADRSIIAADGKDLSFITVAITDNNELTVPDAMNKVSFSIEGRGEIVATDNGNPASMVFFASKEREAYFGLLLVIVRAEKGKAGIIKVTAKAEGLKGASVEVRSK